MDSGKFESLSKVGNHHIWIFAATEGPKPYVFHQVMRSLFTPLRLDTDSRNLEFVTSLDPTIDEVSCF